MFGVDGAPKKQILTLKLRFFLPDDILNAYFFCNILDVFFCFNSGAIGNHRKFFAIVMGCNITIQIFPLGNAFFLFECPMI